MNLGSISDWKLAKDKKDLETRIVNTNKLEDYQRIKDANLPHFEDFFLDYLNFSLDNPSLLTFLSECESIVLRAIPKISKLPKRHVIGDLSFRQCRDFLKKVIPKNKKDHYQIFLTRHEITNKSGIIISKPKKLILEMGDFGLDDLEHGRTPSLAYLIDFYKLGHLENKETWLKEGNPYLRKIGKKALDYIRINPDSFNPLFLRGYFEFVVTEKKNQIKFLDYKIDEMYLQ
jgi:hypothetical protein